MRCSCFDRRLCVRVPVAAKRGLCAAIVLSGLFSTYAHAQFIGLRGDATGDGFHSRATGISADGQTAVGVFALEAFLWNEGPPGIGLGGLFGVCCDSTASRVSADGSVVVGTSLSTIGPIGTREAFRWTAETGMVGLGVLSDISRFGSSAADVSHDGTVVVGSSFDYPISEPFIWRLGEGMKGLGVLVDGAPEFTRNSASGVSADGTIVVGVSNNAVGYEAFRWTQESGLLGIGDLPGGSLASKAIAISTDGSTIVGEGIGEAGTEAFRWTSETGMIALGDLSGGEFGSVATAVSTDGAIVLGRSINDLGWSAFFWDQENGMRDLQQVLTGQYGLDLAGWHLTEANGISADGFTIVGTGISPSGDQEAWIAHIPEPATLTLSLFAVIFSAVQTNLLFSRRRFVELTPQHNQ